MPYIKIIDRAAVDGYLDALIDEIKPYGADNEDGVVNYCISKIINAIYDTKHYHSYNAGVGVLECAKLEFYRRRVAIYEDQKIIENGNI